MVLCVFEINWPAEGDSEGSTVCPEFVLTDGWYKIRAKVDQSLARAARKGKIRVGRKLGIIGARVGVVVLKNMFVWVVDPPHFSYCSSIL
jgi:breast cancer 2 susceptibility protein